MLRIRRGSSWGLLFAGLIGLIVGSWLVQEDGAPGPDRGELELHAVATHGGENFAIATGPVDENVEGVYTLDFLTGDLQCFVFNHQTYKLAGWFKTNIAKDLTPERGKKPSYLLTTGAIKPGGTYSNFKPAGCICYVADGNTGEIACYTYPWTQAATSTGVPQVEAMSLIHKWKTRELDLRK